MRTGFYEQSFLPSRAPLRARPCGSKAPFPWRKVRTGRWLTSRMGNGGSNHGVSVVYWRAHRRLRLTRGKPVEMADDKDDDDWGHGK